MHADIYADHAALLKDRDLLLEVLKTGSGLICDAKRRLLRIGGAENVGDCIKVFRSAEARLDEALRSTAALLESTAPSLPVPTWQQQAEREATDFFEKDGHRWVRMTTEEEAAKRLAEGLV